MNVARAALLSVLCASHALVAAGGSEPDVAARLLASGTVSCEPSIAHFCANIHVSCSGRSRIETVAFTLRGEGDAAWLLERGGVAASRVGRMQLDEQGDHVLVWLDPPPDLVRLRADGRYSFRIRRRDEYYMSYGRCR